MDEITHSVRRSQAVLQYGVGAMIDFPSQVLMTATSELWENPDIIHDERLEKLLGVSEFITPSDCGIPFVRFPRWYVRNAENLSRLRNGKKNIRRNRQEKICQITIRI